MRGFARFMGSGNEGFATANQTQETQNIRNYFAIAAPNVFANNDNTLNTVDLTKTSNPYVASKYDNVLDPRRRANISGQVGMVNQKNIMCQGSDSNQFRNLSNLAATQTDPSNQYCGWVYDNNNPDNGGGAFGTVNGPFNTDKKGTWMWNLADAKKKYHTSICRRVTSCADINASNFSGLCGWCNSAGRGVPINPDNSLAYPTGDFTSCTDPSSLITTGGSCPTGTPGTSTPGAVQPGSSAALASNTTCPTDGSKLTRDCLLQKVLGAGCTNNGTLWNAILASNPADYTSVLSQNTAFKTYQQRAIPSLNEQALRNGNLTVSDALNGFTRVKSVADSTASGINLGVKVAAGDLCYNAGSIESYDFCAELISSSTPPFDITCLQKAFLRAGGQYAGTDFPLTTMARKWWASMANWGEVTTYIQNLYNETRSQTRNIQVEAMKKFYGINLAKGTITSNKVIFYSGCNYTGKATQLAVGEYPFLKLLAAGYDNDTLQSVKVPPGMSVTMWEHDINGGREVTLTADNPCLSNIGYMNTVSSCRVNSDESMELKVIFYSGCNYTGKATQLAVGEYPFLKLLAAGYDNDTLQSVKVPPGMSVTMWEHDINGGREVTLTADNPCLSSIGYMNTVSSCRVKSDQSTGTWDAETTKCIKAVEQTGFIPRITWGQTPPSDHNANCDNVLCPWFKAKYGSYNNVPNTYVEAINYCKSRGL